MPDNNPTESPKTRPYVETIPPELDRSGEQKIWLLAAVAFVLAVATVGGFLYAHHQSAQMAQLAQTNQALNSSLTQMQDQLQSVTDRLTRRIEEAKATPPPEPVQTRTAVRKPAPKPEPPRDPRVDALQNQLTEQQKALAAAREDADRTRADLGQTREELGKTRDELSGRLDSTRDELNGSLGRTRDELNGGIARNHDELVALQKRGERAYFEFSLDKSKQFQKVGPLSVSLRRVDFKRKSFDVALLVDDFTLQKKNVNLYEPVWINLNDRPEPVQLIVNHIDKDKIVGYLSAPKYRKAELATTAVNRIPTQVILPTIVQNTTTRSNTVPETTPQTMPQTTSAQTSQVLQ